MLGFVCVGVSEYFSSMPSKLSDSFSNHGERIELQSTTNIYRHNPLWTTEKCAYLVSPPGLQCREYPSSTRQFQPPLSRGMHPFATHPIFRYGAAHCIVSAEDQEAENFRRRRKCDVVYLSNSTRSGSCTDVESTRTAPSRIYSSP